MLHPSEFKVNETWLLFKLNDAPIHTEAEGDFNCIALMDAASCFLLTNAFVSASELEVSLSQSRKMIRIARAHKQELPKTMLIPNEMVAEIFVVEARRQGIEIKRLPVAKLHILIGEAQELFKERFGGGSVQ